MIIVKLPLIKFVFFFVLWITILPSDSFSQNDLTDANLLEEIVTTGTKTSKKHKEGPVKTDLLNQVQIKEKHYRDASEAILEVPGVTLSNVRGKQGKSAVMQGLGGDHVLLVIDGVPVSANSNSGFDLTQISTADIQQIEVVKGGASALHGGQAMGGVINIITKEPSEKAQYGIEVSRDQYTDGSPKKDVGYNALKGYFNKRHDNTSYKLSVANNKSSSIDRDKKTITRDTPDVDKLMGSLWLEQRLNANNKIYADYNHYHEDNLSYIAKRLPDQTYKEVHNIGKVEGKKLKLGHKLNLSESSFQIYGFYEAIDDSLVLSDDPKTPYIESQKNSSLIHHRIETQSTFPIGESHVGTMGLVFDNNLLEEKNKTSTATTSQTQIEVDNKRGQTLEAYLQDDWLLPNAHEIVTGIRYTKDQYFGENFSPKVSYSKTFNHTGDTVSVLRSSVGSGFRIPSLKERFYLVDHTGTAGYILIGNEDLEPEKSVSYQLGWEIYKKRFYSFSINGFINVVDKLIMTKELPPNSGQRIFTYENVDSVQIRGVELSGDYYFQEKFKISPSLTYSRAENRKDGSIIPNRPYYFGQTIAKYTFKNPDIDLIYTFRLSGASYTDATNKKKHDSFNTSDFRLNYHYTKDISYFFGVLNIFDEAREPLKDNTIGTVNDQRPILNRTFLLGLSYDV